MVVIYPNFVDFLDLNNTFFNFFPQKSPTHLGDICIAPVFRSRPEISDGFLRGGFWKYNAKPSNILPFPGNDDDEDDGEEKHTIQDDIVVAEQDVAAGLIRMGILPRICYLLEVRNDDYLRIFLFPYQNGVFIFLIFYFYVIFIILSIRI